MDYIIIDNLNNLINEFKKEGIKINLNDFNYEFLNRCESLSIDSSLIYPDLNIPSKFGVYRGYNGGGIHSSLKSTEIFNLPKNRQFKAERLLNKFNDTFWQVLKDIDALNDEPLEIWDSVTI